MKCKSSILFLLLLFSFSCFPCENLSSIKEMSDCYIQDYNKSKEELSSTYNKVITLTSSKQRELLISSQEKWFDYMNADCEFETHASRYGKIKIMVMTICLQVKTEQRISDLKKMLNCSDGDSSCGFD